MKNAFYKPFKLAVVGAMLSAGVTGAPGQDTLIEIVADNDWALFAGTATGVTSLIYQNNVDWPSQLAAASSFTFNLQPGETTFYLVGLGGGGFENISGMVNGVDLTSIDVSMSSSMGPSLTGFVGGSGAVTAGSFNATLSDVQAAFSSLTWGSPVPTTGADTVAVLSPTGQGFHFDPDTAHLFRFDASEVGVVPEPSTIVLLLGASAAIALSRCRRHK